MEYGSVLFIRYYALSSNILGKIKIHVFSACINDEKLYEDLYSIEKPWIVSNFTFSPKSLRLNTYLDQEDNCTWRQLKYSNNSEYSFIIHERGKLETAIYFHCGNLDIWF